MVRNTESFAFTVPSYARYPSYAFAPEPVGKLVDADTQTRYVADDPLVLHTTMVLAMLAMPVHVCNKFAVDPAGLPAAVAVIVPSLLYACAISVSLTLNISFLARLKMFCLYF